MSSDAYSLPEEGSTRYRLKLFRWHVAQLFPDVPEGDLWEAVLYQAVEDVTQFKWGDINNYHVAEAKSYLNRPDIAACAICGVDSDYIRMILGRVGIDI